MKLGQELVREVEYILAKEELVSLQGRMHVTPEEWKRSLPHYRGPSPAPTVIPKENLR